VFLEFFFFLFEFNWSLGETLFLMAFRMLVFVGGKPLIGRTRHLKGNFETFR